VGCQRWCVLSGARGGIDGSPAMLRGGPDQATRVQEETSEPTPTGIIALALHVWVLPIRFFFFFARRHSSRDPYLIRRALRRIASSSMAGDGSHMLMLGLLLLLLLRLGL
jgi:hypothetical protein